MATGPNQILIKRSDVASNEPSGLSYGEPAVNTADGKIFIAQQTNGTPSGDLWEFHGTTNGGVVTSVNGETGDVEGVSSVNGATGAVTVVSSFNGGTGAVEGVASFNGVTGAIEGVSEFAGFTGAVAEGVTTNQILFHNGLGITGSEDFTFDGTDVVLGGQGHFDGGMDGPQQKKIKADEALAAGDPVYITGNVGASDRVTVAKADASDSAKMPAAGIVKTAFSTNQEGYMTIGGSIDLFDTSGYTSNDELYVSPGGGLTLERPISASDLVQKVVRVGRVDASTGTIIVTGANRANDVPNLIHARAGISSDAGITVAGTVHAENYFDYDHGNDTGMDLSTNHVISLKTGNNTRMRIVSSGIENKVALKAEAVINAQAGISLDAAGITFADGTFQSTAASGSGLDTSQPLTLTGGDTSTASFTIESDDTGTNAAPIIDLIRDPSDGGTGTNGDYLGQIKFKGQSSTGTERVYAKITGKIGTATNNDEDGVVEHMVQADGSSEIIFRTNKNGIQFTDGKKLIFEGDTNNTSETTLYVEDPTSDQTITLPDDTGTVALTKNVVTSVNGSTGDVTVTGGGGGGPTMSIGFILDGNGSPLGTGDKLDALRQIPYDAYVLSTSAFVQAGVSGTDKTIAFNINKTSTLSNSITGTALELGNTASADQSGFTFDGIAGGIYFRELANNGNSAGSTLNANEWIYPEVTGNSGDIDKIQIFMTIQPL